MTQTDADHRDACLRHINGLRTHLSHLAVHDKPLRPMFNRQLATIESAVLHSGDDTTSWGEDE